MLYLRPQLRQFGHLCDWVDFRHPLHEGGVCLVLLPPVTTLAVRRPHGCFLVRGVVAL